MLFCKYIWITFLNYESLSSETRLIRKNRMDIAISWMLNNELDTKTDVVQFFIEEIYRKNKTENKINLGISYKPFEKFQLNSNSSLTCVHKFIQVQWHAYLDY